MSSNIKQWVLINFNWGDSLVELLNFCHIYKEFGVIASVGSNGILPYKITEARKICEWLNAQPFIQKVIMIDPIPGYHIQKEQLLDICNHYNIDPNRIDTSLSLAPIGGSYQTYTDVPKLILPYSYTIKDYGIPNLSKCVLVNPYSVSSNSLMRHWKHWHELMVYLFSYTPYTYVLIGLYWNVSYDFDQHKNVINLLNNRGNCIEGNCDIYSLSNKAMYTLTTFNSLSHWCINQDNPSTIFGLPASHYYPWEGTIHFTSNKVKFFPVSNKFMPAVYHILKDLEYYHGQ